MKTKCCGLFLLVALWAGVQNGLAHEAQFFRVSGPTAVTITAFHPDGTLVFSNAEPGATYTVQTVSALPGGTNWMDYVQIPVTNSVNTNQIIDLSPPAGMVLIPAGTFTMGDVADTNENGDAAPITVYVSAFYLDQTDVTEALWQQVYNWALNHGYSFDDSGSGLDGDGYAKGPNYPVVDVNWYDCVKWCNARSEMEGRTPAYYTTAAQTAVYRTGDIDVANGCVNWTGGYRMATEAEWEKAARGGLSGQRFPWGNTISWSQANYYGDPLSLDPTGFAYDLATAIDYDPAFSEGDDYNEIPFTSPVGYFAANGYGLYDMAGNVWQWCWDWYGTYAGGSDPRGPTSGPYRVYRGGSWYSYAFGCRSAYRSYGYPYNYYVNDLFGFRSALPAGQ